MLIEKLENVYKIIVEFRHFPQDGFSTAPGYNAGWLGTIYIFKIEKL